MTEDLNAGAAAPVENAPAPAPAPEASAPAVEAPEAAHERSWDEDLSAIYDKANKPRDEAGKFKSNSVADALAGDSSQAEEPADTTSTDQSPETGAPEQAKPAIEAPVSWSAEMKAKFATLPPEAQDYIAQREREATAKITQLGQQAKAYEPIARVVEQHKDAFQRHGVSFDDGISRLLAVQQAMDSNPVATIQNLARMYGVDLSGAQPSEPNVEVMSLRQQLAQVQRQLAETRGMTENYAREIEASKDAAVKSAIQKFAADKPDFEILRPLMARHAAVLQEIEPGLSEMDILTKAYEAAAAEHPEIRAKRLEAEARKLAEKQRAEAEKAAKVARLNVKSSASAKPGRLSIEDDLSAAYDRAMQARG